MRTKKKKEDRHSAYQYSRFSYMGNIKFQLLERDPLWRKLMRILEASEMCEEDRKPGGTLDQLKQSLEHKYELHGICSPRHSWKITPVIVDNGNIIVGKRNDDTPKARAAWAIPLVVGSPMSIIWSHFEGDLIQRIPPEPPKDKSKAPRFFVEVDLERVGVWDLAYLTDAFREAIRGALKTWKKNWKEPPELGALRYVRPETFERDLRRYDLHMNNGLSFRLIALVESLERQGKDAPKRQRRVGFPVPAESGVADSVHRIYRAIYRRPYNAKRRRLDHPAEGVDQYSCPHHPGNNCDIACKYLKDWRKRIQSMLPSDNTGMLWNTSELTEEVLRPRPNARKNPHPRAD